MRLELANLPNVGVQFAWLIRWLKMWMKYVNHLRNERLDDLGLNKIKQILIHGNTT